MCIRDRVMLKRSLVALLLAWPLSTTAVPLMDLVDIEGIRGNQLIGYGLVAVSYTHLPRRAAGAWPVHSNWSARLIPRRTCGQG